MNKRIISPSLLSADFSTLKEEIEKEIQVKATNSLKKEKIIIN